MKEWKISLFYKLVIFFIFAILPNFIINYIKIFTLDIQKYIILYSFEIILLVCLYVIFGIRLRLYSGKLIDKVKRINQRYGIENTYSKPIMGVETFIDFEYYFNEEINKLARCIDDQKKEVEKLRKENLTRFQLKEYQLKSVIEEVNNLNESLLNKERVLDSFMNIFKDLIDTKLNYSMFFEELLYLLEKNFSIEDLVILRPVGEEYKQYVKLSRSVAFNEKVYQELKKLTSGVYFNHSINQISGYKLIINLENPLRKHGYIFLNGENIDKYTTNSTLMKIIEVIAHETTNLAENIYQTDLLREKISICEYEKDDLKHKLVQKDEELEERLIELNDRYDEVTLFYDMMKKVQGEFDQKNFEKTYLKALTEKLNVSAGLIYYYDKNTVNISNFYSSDKKLSKINFVFLKRLENIIFSKNETDQSFYVNDLKDLNNYHLLPVEIRKNIKNLMKIPIYQKGETIGALLLMNKNRDFTMPEIRFTLSLNEILAIILENSKNLQVKIDVEATKKEKDIYENIQKRLLVTENKTNKYFDISFRNKKNTALKNSHFKVREIASGKIFTSFINTNYKKFDSLFILEKIDGLIEGMLYSKEDISLEETVKEINRVLYAERVKDVSLTLTLYDVKNKEFRFINIGENLPLMCVVEETKFRKFDTTREKLGNNKKMEVREIKTELAGGDLFITIHPYISNVNLTLDKIRDVLLKNHKYPATYIAKKIYSDLKKTENRYFLNATSISIFKTT